MDGKNTPEQPWEGDDLGALGVRLDYNIVAYDELNTSTRRFGTFRGLQDWLDDALSATGVKITVHRVDLDRLRRENRAQGNVPAMAMDIVRGPDTPGDQVGRYRVFDPWTDVPPRYADLGHGGREAVGLQVTTDGPTVTTFRHVQCVGQDQFGDCLVPVGETAGTTGETADAWVALEFAQVPGFTVFPVAETMLQVTTDRDGADVGVFAQDRGTRLAELQREENFRDRWARWLDPTVMLTPEETAAGLRQVENEISVENEIHAENERKERER